MACGHGHSENSMTMGYFLGFFLKFYGLNFFVVQLQGFCTLKLYFKAIYYHKSRMLL